jgi:hypothetical protein
MGPPGPLAENAPVQIKARIGNCCEPAMSPDVWPIHAGAHLSQELCPPEYLPWDIDAQALPPLGLEVHAKLLHAADVEQRHLGKATPTWIAGVCQQPASGLRIEGMSKAWLMSRDARRDKPACSREEGARPCAGQRSPVGAQGEGAPHAWIVERRSSDIKGQVLGASPLKRKILGRMAPSGPVHRPRTSAAGEPDRRTGTATHAAGCHQSLPHSAGCGPR